MPTNGISSEGGREAGSWYLYQDMLRSTCRCTSKIYNHFRKKSIKLLDLKGGMRGWCMSLLLNHNVQEYIANMADRKHLSRNEVSRQRFAGWN